MPFRLFLSHSTPHPDRARMQEIASGIETASGGKIKVLWDGTQIASGDEWRRRISYLLHACDGAALLLDRRALDSPWVRAESTFLSLRAVWDRQFTLVPLSLIPGEELKRILDSGDWPPAALRDLQFASGVDGVVATLAAAFVELASRRPGQSPMERLAHAIGNRLKEASAALLQDLADDLGNDVPYDDRDDHVRAALVVARTMIREPNLTAIRELLDKLGHDFVNSHGGAILDQLTPLPIDPDGAAALRDCDRDGPNHTWLQTEQAPWTVPLYVYRAHLTYGRPPVVTLQGRHANAESARQELLKECRNTLFRYSIKKDGPPTDEDLERRLKLKHPLYVCTPPIDAEVLADLIRRYPRISFILHHRADDESSPPPGVRRVVPQLERTREEAIHDDYALATVSLLP